MTDWNEILQQTTLNSPNRIQNKSKKKGYLTALFKSRWFFVIRGYFRFGIHVLFVFTFELKAISFQLPASRFHFSLFRPPFTSHLFACYPPVPKWFSTCLFRFYSTYGCVSFEMYTLHPFSFFRHSFSISHISSFHFPFATRIRSFLSYIYIYIHVRVWVSRSQPYSCLANEADIFEESLPKIVGSRSCHRGIRLSFEDVHLFHGIRG